MESLTSKSGLKGFFVEQNAFRLGKGGIWWEGLV